MGSVVRHTVEEQRDFIGHALSTCVAEFFESYGVVVEARTEASAGSESLELGSVLGFRGKGVRGGLAFVAPIDFVTELLPVPRSLEDADGQLRDWSAEIANQLVGRLKNKLAARAVDFDVGTPVSFTGRSIRLVFLPDAEGLSLHFQAASTSLRVHLDCSLAPEIAAGDISELRIAPEGDVLLF